MIAMGSASGEDGISDSQFRLRINDSVDIELGFVYMGEFELTADMTGPTENLKATIEENIIDIEK